MQWHDVNIIFFKYRVVEKYEYITIYGHARMASLHFFNIIQN